nr:integrase, catalytic region, zinc finger, CCHC-type, peptidase aspartic, catalytic [Tanacetum cinerariifolium]
VVQIVLWYLDSGCSKNMTGDRSQLINYEQKFLGTVKFENDHVAKIMGYEETLLLAEESRSKMIEKQKDPKMAKKKVITKSIDYAVLNQLSKDFETRFVSQTELSAEQAFWSRYSVQPEEPNLSASTTIVEVPKELPKFGLAAEQHCVEKNKFQDKMKNVLKENDQLLTQALSVDIVNIVVHDHVKSACMNVNSQAKDVIILNLREKLQSLTSDVKERKVKREIEEIKTLNIELDHRVTKLVAENEHLKQTYKQLYDSIKPSRVRSKEQCLGHYSSQEKFKQTQRQRCRNEAVLSHSIDPELLKIDVAPLALKLRKNRTVHTDYIRHTQEEAATLREIVESERMLNPLNTSLDYACKYTKRIQELLNILQQTCPCITDLGSKLVSVTPKNKNK